MFCWSWLRRWFCKKPVPIHLRHGRLGERVARRYLQNAGLKFLAANYKTSSGEIDLIFRDSEVLVFVEVKTRSEEKWIRPAAAVDARKRRLISKSALQYLRRIGSPCVPVRFDIVEVILENSNPAQIRHLPNAFPLSSPYRYS